MALNLVGLPVEYFPNPLKARPVFNGKIYVGEPGTDPQEPANQKQVYVSDTGITQTPVAVAQPISTGNAGVPVWPESSRNPVSVFVDGAYSIKVLDNNDNQVYYFEDVTDGTPLNAETGVSSVESVADLRLFEPTLDGQQISLKQHTTGGKGGGNFYYDSTDNTTLDNNGTVIVTAGGARWKRRDAKNISAYMFGAIGDGVTNDTAALDSLCAAISDGFCVDISGGTFISDLGHSISNKGRFKITGNGIIKNSGAFATRTNYLQFIECEDFSLSGVTFEGPRTFPGAGPSFIYYGIDMQDCNNVDVEGCTFKGVDVGYAQRAKGFAELTGNDSYNGTAGNTNVRIFNNHYEDVTTQCNFLGFGYAANISCHNNTAKNIKAFCKVDGQHILSTATIYTPRTAPRTRNIKVHNNLIETVNDTQTGVSEYDAVIQVEEFVDDVRVHDNMIADVNCGDPSVGIPYIRFSQGQWSEGFINCSATNNHLIGNDTRVGIQIRHDNDGNLDSDYLTIANNEIEMDLNIAGGTVGILVTALQTGSKLLSNLVIKDNVGDMQPLSTIGRFIDVNNDGAATNIPNALISGNRSEKGSIFLLKMDSPTIEGNKIINPSSGVAMGISANQLTNASITRNYVEGGDRGIRLVTSTNIKISYNEITKSDAPGIAVQTACDEIDIHHNDIYNVCVGNGTTCIQIDEAINWSATNNRLVGSTNAIYGARGIASNSYPTQFNANSCEDVTAEFRVSATNLNWPIQTGTQVIWVDSTGDMRIKNGNPTSDTDGVVVGTQS